MDLLLFATDPALVVPAVAGGVAAIVVDWERRGKAERQHGADTLIAADDADDLVRVRAATQAPVICRLDRPGAWSPGQAAQAAELGADEVLVPMVRGPEDVAPVLEAVGGSCRVGLLIETPEAVESTAELATLPLSRIYVGLNDLAIERRTPLFAPFVDGTVDEVRAAVGDVPFGVGGLTVPGSGRPIPVDLLLGELSRLRVDFTFLRRSFWRDVEGRDAAEAVREIRAAAAWAARRGSERVEADRARLVAALEAEPVVVER